MNTELLRQIRELSVSEPIDLIEAIWDGIAVRGEAPPLTDDQVAELDRRLADHLAHPDDVVSWDDVRAEARAKLRR